MPFTDGATLKILQMKISKETHQQVNDFQAKISTEIGRNYDKLNRMYKNLCKTVIGDPGMIAKFRAKKQAVRLLIKQIYPNAALYPSGRIVTHPKK